MGVRSKLGIGALVLIAGTALLLRGLTATGSDGSSLSTGLIQQEVAGLRLLSPGELTLIPGAAGADEDTTIVEHDVYQATGLGLIMSLTRITYVEGTAPFVDDAVTRTVAAVQRRVTRPDGSDEFTHLATRVGVSGRYAIRVRATYVEPVAGLQRWTEALFLQQVDDLWQIQIVETGDDVPEARDAADEILTSVEMLS